jgi:hypothetical protein
LVVLRVASAAAGNMFRRTHIVEQFIKSGSKQRGWFWLRLCEGDARGGKPIYSFLYRETLLKFWSKNGAAEFDPNAFYNSTQKTAKVTPKKLSSPNVSSI